MRPIVLALVTLVAAASLAAQEASPADAATVTPKPDYSTQSLMRLFRPEDPRPPVEKRFTWHFGSVEFKALHMRWRIAYLPIVAPLPGSVPRTNREMIDPFALTGTEFATTPRTFRTRRAMSSEMRRIERLERERAHVVATPE